METGIIQNLINTVQKEPISRQNITNNELFESFFDTAVQFMNDTDQQILDLEAMQLQIASGESDDLLGMTLLQKKAENSFQFFVNVTNKTVEAYREIMRMQV